jgi:hypothetical protein
MREYANDASIRDWSFVAMGGEQANARSGFPYYGRLFWRHSFCNVLRIWRISNALVLLSWMGEVAKALGREPAVIRGGFVTVTHTADPHSTSLRAGSPLRYASVGMTKCGAVLSFAAAPGTEGAYPFATVLRSTFV